MLRRHFHQPPPQLNHIIMDVITYAVLNHVSKRGPVTQFNSNFTVLDRQYFSQMTTYEASFAFWPRRRL